jgi:hypothetical protein
MPPRPLSPEARKEKKKLLANNLDRASTSCLTLGVFGPLAAAYFNLPGVSVNQWSFVVGAVCWGLASLALHHGAQLTLDDLR